MTHEVIMKSFENKYSLNIIFLRIAFDKQKTNK
jgi:hypothetical protein